MRSLFLELTYACNASCCHCYVPRGMSCVGVHLDAVLACRVMEEYRALGPGAVLFTGGEPLLHPDWSRLYSFAHELGLAISVFTNGLLVDDRILALFEAMPPDYVRVSVFGSESGSYARVAGIDGFRRSISVITALHALGIDVSVKMPVVLDNKEDVLEVRSIIRKLGVNLHADVRIVPDFHGGKSPLAQRLSPQEVVDARLSQKLENYFYDLSRAPDEAVFVEEQECKRRRYCRDCHPFLVDPRGMLQMCPFVREPAFDLADQSLVEASEGLASVIDLKEPKRCTSCRHRAYCTYCPGWALVEHGEIQPVEWLCELAEAYASRFGR